MDAFQTVRQHQRDINAVLERVPKQQSDLEFDDPHVREYETLICNGVLTHCYEACRYYVMSRSG